MKLDAADLRILTALQRHGRLSKTALAREVHLSPTACLQRLRRLEGSGLIRGYTAILDLDRIGRAVGVWVEVVLEQHRYEDFQRFETAVRDVEEIVECWATGGGIDYLLRVVAPDIDAYQRLMDDLLARRIGIARYFTYVVTRPVKHRPQPPVALFRRADPGD